MASEFSMFRHFSTIINCVKFPMWAAPEVLGSGDRNTREADIFAFGMVVLEVGRCVSPCLAPNVEGCLTLSQVFTGKYPFSKFTAAVAISKIMDGERPDRPREPSLTDPLWEMACTCWCQDAARRPAITKVVGILREWPVFFLLKELSL